jgi:hypothetical protein
MRKFLLAACLVLPVTAQAAPFCTHASAAVALFNAQLEGDYISAIRSGGRTGWHNSEDAIADVYSQCHHGDAISLERGTLMQRLCDPSQPIQQIGPNVICRLN